MEASNRLEAEIRQHINYSIGTSPSGAAFGIVYNRSDRDGPWSVWHIGKGCETVVTHCETSDQCGDLVASL